MSDLLFTSAASYLKSLGYDVQGFDPNQPGMKERANQVIVNRIRKEYEREYERRLLKYNASKLVSQVETLVEEVLHDTTGFKSFINKYPLQTSYFGALYEAWSAVDLVLYFRNEMQKQNDVKQIRSSISNVTAYLLDILDGLLKASSEIKYYCKAKAWTWRIFIPLTPN